MSYKWRPTKAQKKEFAEKMQDPDFSEAYYRRKREREEKKRAKSQFNYPGAGGYYVPTREQYCFVLENMHLAATIEEETAFNEVITGYTCNMQIHHDSIHIVNEKRRASNSL